MNEKIGETLGAIDPRLGAIYNSSTEEINNVFRDIGSMQQDAVARYLRASTNRLVSDMPHANLVSGLSGSHKSFRSGTVCLPALLPTLG